MNDFDAEHQIYRTDAVLEYPQSGERIRGRDSIQASREAQPNAKRFTVRRILGGGDLWISELVLTYDGQPSYVVSIMEFVDGEVVRETQYFGDPFSPGPSRAQWVESMGDRSSSVAADIREPRSSCRRRTAMWMLGEDLHRLVM